jgi:hypothetical protein
MHAGAQHPPFPGLQPPAIFRYHFLKLIIQGQMELFFSQQPIPEGTRRTVRLTNPQQQDVEIFFDLFGEAPPPPRTLDGFVAGIIFYAMRSGRQLRVHGTMTKEALCNLSAFQEAWTRWKPDLYQKIEIVPSEIASAQTSSDGQAIAAFSGGVDSVFTILRHNRQQLGNASYLLRHSVLMVHGFDVPLENPVSFEALINRTAPLLQELGLKLKIIRTNLKTRLPQDWEDSFMAQLACCLHNYANEFDYALVGSSEPYDALVLPYGSNPATDFLLSGGTMRIVHDGAGFSRTEKVAYIANNRTACNVLKVCWEGKEFHKNCGVCEKCIRTQANFLAVGVTHPTCFDAPLAPQQITTMPLRGDAYCAELESIIAYAEARGVTGKWLHSLRARVRAYRSPAWRRLKTAMRRIKIVSGMLARAEVREVTTKIYRKLSRP